MAYAEKTDVSIAKTRAEIEDILTRRQATAIGSYMETGKAVIIFRMQERHIRFTLPLPDAADKRFARDGRNQVRTPDKRHDTWEQACRSRWRALYLCIKAKLESIESGIEQFDEAFLGQIVTADNATVYQRTREALAEEYRLGKVQPLLLTGPIS